MSALAWEATLRGRPLATDNFAAGAYPRPRSFALGMREIAPDPEGWIRAIRHDVDRPDAVAHVGYLVSIGELPEPSNIIENPTNGHAHVVWELGRWASRTSDKAMWFFRRVRALLGEITGADAGYAGKFQHNPTHPDFQRWGQGRIWELSEIADFLGERLANFRLKLAWSRKAKINSDTVALGRNCSHFENARVQAYAQVRDYRSKGDEAGFRTAVRTIVDRENQIAEPLSEKECGSIAKSIARWTWRFYGTKIKNKISHRAEGEISRAEYLAEQAKKRAQARDLRKQGFAAKTIAEMLGRCRAWVYNAWAEVYNPDSEGTLDKPAATVNSAPPPSENRPVSAVPAWFTSRPNRLTPEIAAGFVDLRRPRGPTRSTEALYERLAQRSIAAARAFRESVERGFVRLR